MKPISVMKAARKQANTEMIKHTANNVTPQKTCAQRYITALMSDDLMGRIGIPRALAGERSKLDGDAPSSMMYAVISAVRWPATPINSR